MTSRFDTYDLFGVLVPGLLLIGWVPICFSGAKNAFDMPYPDAFVVILMTALAVFAGHLVQAIASAIEPLVFRSWGGRPSDTALSSGLKRYLPEETSTRVKCKLMADVEAVEEHSLFLYAMQLSDGQNVGRARRFNSLYAYHRALLTLVLLCIAMSALSMVSGTGFGAVSLWQRVLLFGAGLALSILFWHRAWQHACYYVREVLLSAEHALDDRKRKEKLKDDEV